MPGRNEGYKKSSSNNCKFFHLSGSLHLTQNIFAKHLSPLGHSATFKMLMIPTRSLKLVSSPKSSSILLDPAWRGRLAGILGNFPDVDHSSASTYISYQSRSQKWPQKSKCNYEIVSSLQAKWTKHFCHFVIIDSRRYLKLQSIKCQCWWAIRTSTRTPGFPLALIKMAGLGSSALSVLSVLKSFSWWNFMSSCWKWV